MAPGQHSVEAETSFQCPHSIMKGHVALGCWRAAWRRRFGGKSRYLALGREETAEEKVTLRCDVVNEDDTIMIRRKSLNGSSTSRDLFEMVARAVAKNVKDLMLILDEVVPLAGETPLGQEPPPSGGVEVHEQTQNACVTEAANSWDGFFLVTGVAWRTRRP